MNPELHILEKLDWQFFGTLTFKSERLPERVRLALFFAWLREFGVQFGPRFPFLTWALRQERGEKFGRVHFHVLVGATRQEYCNPATCFWLMSKWEVLGGGIARVRLFDRRLSAASYITKPDQYAAALDGADVYESSKFGDGASELMLSHRALEVASWRPRKRRALTAAGR